MTSIRKQRKNVHTPGVSFSSVRKRDGRLVPFDLGKIAKAIASAGQASGEFFAATARQLARRVFAHARKAPLGATPTVEQIQNIVEETLLASRFKQTAKAYILYRDQHARIREISEQADLELIDNYLERLDWKVKENSNMAYSLQGEAAGAQAFSNFDTLLAPFIRQNNLSYADVKQALQEFIFNLNVPRLGHLAKNETVFLERLAKLMEIARTSLETKRKVLEQFTARQLYPYTRYYLRDVHERTGRFWHNHFSTIGLVGMNEACLNLLGHDIGTPEGRSFSLRVLDFMRDTLRTFQDETGHLYNLEATPAEGTSYRLAKIDRQKFPDMRSSAGTDQEPFYTNSTQLPVNYSDDIIDMLQLQDELQARYTGGTVQHVFLGEAVPDPQAVKNFVRMVCRNFRLPYFTLTPSFSICPTHGYLNGETAQCPTCGAETEIYSRVVGYLRPVNQWNAGKQAEFAMRHRFHLDNVK